MSNETYSTAAQAYLHTTRMGLNRISPCVERVWPADDIHSFNAEECASYYWAWTTRLVPITRRNAGGGRFEDLLMYWQEFHRPR